MHIYAFGSVCRGEITPESDVDLLLITSEHTRDFKAETFSIYSYNKIERMWQAGAPFAWHLYLESSLIYSSNSSDYLKSLNQPRPYTNAYNDCLKFYNLFQSSHNSLIASLSSAVFDLSNVFVAIRNAAICFSLGSSWPPTFARDAALVNTANKLEIDISVYQTLWRARLLSSRGIGTRLTNSEIFGAMNSLRKVDDWFIRTLERAENCE